MKPNQASQAYREAIHRLIPGGAHTYSKGDDQFPAVAPAAISHGKGAHVWDVDGNRYLDTSMGLTSVSLGHAYEPVLKAVHEEIEKGVNFQRPSHLELEMAKTFLGLVLQHDMIKFAKNGSSVTTAAVKLARAHTGRKLVAFPHDHPFYSYDDWFISKTACNLGVPEEIGALSVTFESDSLEALEQLFQAYPDQIACVITEPEKFNVLEEDFLQKAIDLCHQHGALYIMDEMVTGFKVDFPGAITRYNTKPDMATWGKGIANGFSFCALTGTREIMELGGIQNEGAEKLFLISTTHGGETHALAAAMASIKVFQENDVIGHNHRLGDRFMTEARETIAANQLGNHVEVLGKNWLSAVIVRNQEGTIDNGLRTLLLQEMNNRGILFQGAFVPCFSHTDSDLDFLIDQLNDSLKVVAQGIEEGYEKYLIGAPTKPVFRKYI